MASFRKIIASVLVVVPITLSFSGCANKPYKQAYNRADNFSRAIKDMDYSKIINSSDSVREADAIELKNLCSTHSHSIYENFDKVADSIEYEIDVDTLDTNGNKASVDVIFSMLDWHEEDLKKADTIDVTVTLSMKSVGDKWVVTNTNDVIEKVYEFQELTVVNTSYDVDGSWWFTDNGITGLYTNPTYTNTLRIDLDIDTANLESISNIYYTISIDNVPVFTSGMGMIEGYYDNGRGASVTEEGYLIPGRYTVSFYDRDVLLISDSCTVIVTE